MDTVAVVGVGLIGGSFALAIRQGGFGGKILGVSSPATTVRALELGVIDEAVSLDQACASADLVYLAGPISGIIAQLPRVASLLKPGALVTDAGSTKVRIVEAGGAVAAPSVFLGGHPMAGKESRGVESAEADLFRGRPYVLTPASPADLSTPCIQSFISLVESTGARLVTLSASEHDHLVAFTSHLPQLLSTALASTLADVENCAEVAGPAVIDLTRLALSPYDIWRDILATNSGNIDAAIRAIIEKLQSLRQRLALDLGDDFYTAKVQSENLRKKIRNPALSP